MSNSTFVAFYEDAARAKAAATAEGFSGKDGESWHDFVEASNFNTSKSFDTKDTAEAWLKAEINAYKTVYGCATLRETEPVIKRCRYCTCGGWRILHEYIVEDTGIVEERDLDDPCLED